jgi:hypothetical protein
MIVALVDNGSLEAAATQNLRAAAAALSEAAGIEVHAVSWKHSDRVAPASLGGKPAWTLGPWVRAQLVRGEREFIFVPFFVSAQGAIGSALRSDLEKLQREAGGESGFEFTFAEGLAHQGALVGIVAHRILETIAIHGLKKSPPVILVDHGGPSAASAALRDTLAAEARIQLGAKTGSVAAASMEGVHGPLLADQLAVDGFNRGDVVIALLFLSPGRHAGIDGDVAQICRAAGARQPNLRCHLTGLIGTHPGAIAPLALALRATLANFSNPTFA